MTGQVYFLQVGTDGPIKIGFTASDVKRRVRAIQKCSPHVLRWIGVFAGSRKDERQAHLLLASSHLRAEWFHPTAEVLAFVQQKSPDFEPLLVVNKIIKPNRSGRGSGRRPICVAVKAANSEQETAA